jgi:probable F420-dependent oxidoreductase
VDLEVVLPDESPAMEPERLADLAVAAERLGYRKVWLPDHLLPPREYGDWFGGVYEPLVSLSYIAARTRVIELGTSVLVLPLRSPFVVAKQAATLDRLSGGRFTLGVGIGWERTEFAAVGAAFRERAARTDEGIALLRHLFSGAGGPFEGRFYGYETGVFEPRPARPIPIMVGGTSEPALRRAALLGDEWQAFALDPAGFGERLARLRELTDRPVRATTRIGWDGKVSPAEVVAELGEFADAGAEAVAVWFGGEDGFEERMTALAQAR